MRAAELDLVIEQGSTFQLTVTWKNVDDSIKDITGFNLRMKIRPTKRSSATISSGDYVSGVPTGDIGLSHNSSGGVITISIAADKTAAFSFTKAVYDLEAVSGTNVFRIIEGEVTLSKEVTR
jgi:hypothetical protein